MENEDLKNIIKQQNINEINKRYSNYTKVGSDIGNNSLEELIKIQQQNKKKRK